MKSAIQRSIENEFRATTLDERALAHIARGGFDFAAWAARELAACRRAESNATAYDRALSGIEIVR